VDLRIAAKLDSGEISLWLCIEGRPSLDLWKLGLCRECVSDVWRGEYVVHAIETGFEIGVGGSKLAQSNFRKYSTYIAAQVSAVFFSVPICKILR